MEGVFVHQRDRPRDTIRLVTGGFELFRISLEF